MEQRLPLALVRRSAPTKYDCAPYKSTCKVLKGGSFEMYLQMNSQEDTPRWEIIGNYGNGVDDVVIKDDINNLLSLKI